MEAFKYKIYTPKPIGDYGVNTNWYINTRNWLYLSINTMYSCRLNEYSTMATRKWFSIGLFIGLGFLFYDGGNTDLEGNPFKLLFDSILISILLVSIYFSFKTYKLKLRWYYIFDLKYDFENTNTEDNLKYLIGEFDSEDFNVPFDMEELLNDPTSCNSGFITSLTYEFITVPDSKKKHVLDDEVLTEIAKQYVTD